MKTIRVTETRVYQYVPDLTEIFYSGHGVKTLADALEADKRSYNLGDVTLDELVGTLDVSAEWEIVEVEGDKI